MQTRILLALSLFLLFTAWLTKRLIIDAHGYREIIPHHSNYTKCIKIFGDDRQAGGYEDIVVVDGNTDNAIAVISASDKIKVFHGKADEHAGIFSLDLKKFIESNYNPQQTMTKLKLQGWPTGEQFHPHGISLYPQNKPKYLFAVNHKRDKKGEMLESIEVFEFHYNKLVYLRTLVHPLFYALNDVVALSPSTFCTTNDHYITKQHLTLQAVEDIADLCWSNVVCATFHDDDVAAHVAIDNLCYANGINISPDQKYFFVAQPRVGILGIFKRNVTHNGKEGRPSKVIDIQTNTAIDNVEVSGNDLYLGAHPDILKFLMYTKLGGHAPSHAIRVSFSNSPAHAPWTNYTISELFLSKGEDLSTSAAATQYRNVLMIGPAMKDDHIMVCY